MTAKTARKKVLRVSKAGVRIVSGEDFWTPERLKDAWESTKPVNGEEEFFKFMEEAMAAQKSRNAAAGKR